MAIASRRSIPALVVVALTCTFAPSAPAVLRAQSDAARQGHVVVSVLDKADAPVAGLGLRDFVVREDNASREVLSVTPGAGPGHIVLLVDDTQAASDAVSFVRDGVKAFITATAGRDPAPQVRIVTFGDRPTLRQDFTTTTASLTRAADRIFAQTGSGSRLLEAIGETCRDLAKKHIDGAAIVAIVAERGPEFSEDTHTHVEDALRAAGASLWTVVLRDPRGGDQSSEGRERSIVMGDVTRETGGLNKTVLGPETLKPALEAVAAALGAQYAITYGRPDRLIPASTLTVEAPGHGATVLARRWPTP